MRIWLSHSRPPPHPTPASATSFCCRPHLRRRLGDGTVSSVRSAPCAAGYYPTFRASHTPAPHCRQILVTWLRS